MANLIQSILQDQQNFFGSSIRKSDSNHNSIGFGNLLKDKILETNNLLHKSRDLVQRFAAGESLSIHEIKIAAEEANIALELTMQLRSKALAAYNTVLRTQV